MAKPPPTYDLVLLLDPQIEEQARTKILADTREAIAAKGGLVNDADWGDRALSYPIAHRTDAEYHLLQFHAGAPALLGELDRTLRITDGILRFRIVKLGPGTPDAPDMRAGASAAPQARHGEGAASPRAAAEGAAPPAEQNAEPPAEQNAETPSPSAESAGELAASERK